MSATGKMFFFIVGIMLATITFFLCSAAAITMALADKAGFAVTWGGGVAAAVVAEIILWRAAMRHAMAA